MRELVEHYKQILSETKRAKIRNDKPRNQFIKRKEELTARLQSGVDS